MSAYGYRCVSRNLYIAFEQKKSRSFTLTVLSIYLSMYLLLVQKEPKHNMSITYSGQDRETTMVSNTVIKKNIKITKTVTSDQMKSGQLGDEIKADSKLSMYK